MSMLDQGPNQGGHLGQEEIFPGVEGNHDEGVEGPVNLIGKPRFQRQVGPVLWAGFHVRLWDYHSRCEQIIKYKSEEEQYP